MQCNKPYIMTTIVLFFLSYNIGDIAHNWIKNRGICEGYCIVLFISLFP